LKVGFGDESFVNKPASAFESPLGLTEFLLRDLKVIVKFAELLFWPSPSPNASMLAY